MESGIVKTSAILIASADVQAMYASVREVPEPLRKRLVECTTGRNSGTIVIADRRGKEEIERTTGFERVPLAHSLPASSYAKWRRVWPALAALIVGAAGAWLAFVIRW